MCIQSARSLIKQQLEYYSKFIPGLEGDKDSLNHELELVQNRIEIYKEKVNDLEMILNELDEDYVNK
ncbi:hypothetical protein ACWA2B_10430 [Paenibacillus sp. CMM36]